MNYKKIAEYAHVSVSSVSKAFSESGDISDETRERIFAAARELGCFDKYYKNKFAKRVIAVICPEFGSPYYGACSEQIRKIVNEKNDVAVFSSGNFDPSLESYLADYYATYAKVDGIMFIDNKTRRFPKYSVPIVTTGRSNTDFVGCDISVGMKKAVSALVRSGRGDICFIGETLTVAKEEIFLEAASPLRPTVLRSGKRFEEAGMECAEKFLALARRPSAVVAAYDDIAIGFMGMLKRYGISVPEEVAVVGIDNIPRASHLEIPLTSIDLRVEEITSKALEILYNKIEHPAEKGIANILYPSELVCRKTASTGTLQ